MPPPQTLRRFVSPSLPFFLSFFLPVSSPFCSPYHDLVPLGHELDPVPVPFDSRQQVVCGNPARSTGKDVYRVDAEIEGLAVLVFLLYELNTSETNSLGGAVEENALLVYLHGDIV